MISVLVGLSLVALHSHNCVQLSERTGSLPMLWACLCILVVKGKLMKETTTQPAQSQPCKASTPHTEKDTLVALTSVAL